MLAVLILSFHVLSLFFFNQFEIISQLSPHYFSYFLVSFFHFMLKCSQTFILIKIIAVNSESLIRRWVRSIYPSPACKPTIFDSYKPLGNQDDILGRDTAIKKIQKIYSIVCYSFTTSKPFQGNVAVLHLPPLCQLSQLRAYNFFCLPVTFLPRKMPNLFCKLRGWSHKFLITNVSAVGDCKWWFKLCESCSNTRA